MSQTYLVYDTETSGLNHSFDQILQFAAVRTDLEFNPIPASETEFRMKLRPDVIPSPGALLTTQMEMADLHQGCSEYEGIQQIHALCNAPGTISIGYNSLRFDDGMLRFAFHRNLLDPYTHQFKNECGRLDLLPITLLYYLFKPDTLIWPQVKGKTSLKLELINEENQLATGMAHDALVDVWVTIALAKRLKESSPKMWAYCLNFFQQSWVVDQLENDVAFLTDDEGSHYPEALLIDTYFGAGNQFQQHALCLGYQTAKQKRANWLTLDSVDFEELTDLEGYPIQMGKKVDEPPLVVPYAQKRDKRPREKQERSARNKAWLAKNPQMLSDLVEHVQQQTPFYNDKPDFHVDADGALYLIGFASAADKKTLGRFQRGSLAEKQGLVSKISDETRRELAARLLFRNYDLVDIVEPHLHQKGVDYLQSLAPVATGRMPLIDYKHDTKMTPYEALADLQKRRATAVLSAKDHTILNQLELYLLQNFIYPTVD